MTINLEYGSGGRRHRQTETTMLNGVGSPVDNTAEMVRFVN